jgi:hypothetical protein
VGLHFYWFNELLDSVCPFSIDSKLPDSLPQSFNFLDLILLVVFDCNTGLDEQLPIAKLCLKVHEIPILYKVSSEVNYTVPLDFDPDIMPR